MLRQDESSASGYGGRTSTIGCPAKKLTSQLECGALLVGSVGKCVGCLCSLHKPVSVSGLYLTEEDLPFQWESLSSRVVRSSIPLTGLGMATPAASPRLSASPIKIRHANTETSAEHLFLIMEGVSADTMAAKAASICMLIPITLPDSHAPYGET